MIEMTNVIKQMIAPINPACLNSILVENRYVKVSITSKTSEQIEIHAHVSVLNILRNADQPASMIVFFRCCILSIVLVRATDRLCCMSASAGRISDARS